MKVKFVGRKMGSIGSLGEFIVEVKTSPAEHIDACRLELDRLGYEHVQRIESYDCDCPICAMSAQ